MNFILHNTFPTELATEWNELLPKSILNAPFLRFEYLQQWWQTRGGGEWPQEAQLVLVTAHEDDRLMAVAPLFLSEHEGRPSLLLLGSIEISDFLGLIVQPADLQRFLSGLLDFLATNSQVPAWQVLDLHNVLESSGILNALQAEATQRGWQYHSEQSYHSPYIQLPGDWEEYLSGLDKKQRHEIRRKMRRMEEAYPTSRFYFVEDSEALPEAIDRFFQLMAFDPQKEAFLTEPMRQAMRATISNAFEHGYLQLAFLELDSSQAAAYLNFNYDERLWVYNSGLDPQFYSVSAGWVLLAYLLRWSINNGLPELDFMRGNEDYKYRFGAVDRFVYHASLTRN